MRNTITTGFTILRQGRIHINRKGALLILLILNCSLFVHSQDDLTEDQLIKKITDYKKRDTTLFNMYKRMSKLTIGEHYEESREYADKAMKLAREINFQKGIGKIEYHYGNIFRQLSEADSARHHYKTALQTFKSIQHKKGYSTCQNAIGVTYYMQGNFDEALKLFRQSIETDNKYNNGENLEPINNIASIYGQKGNYDKAEQYFKKVLKLLLDRGENLGVNQAYNNLGVVNESKGNWKQALEFYQKANKIEEKEGNEEDMIVSYMNIGRIFLNQEDFPKALEYFQKSKEISLRFNKRRMLIRAMTHEGVIFNELKEFSKAIEIQQKSIKIGREIGDQLVVSFALNNLGDALFSVDSIDQAFQCYSEAQQIKAEINDVTGLEKSYTGLAKVHAHKEQWDKALEYALKGKELADIHENLVSQMHLNNLLSEVYEGKKNYKLAFKHTMEYVKYKDSLYKEENVRKIAQLEYEYMYTDSLESATQRELVLSNRVKQAELDTAKSRQFTLWLVIGLLSLLLIAAIIISYLVIKNTRTKYKNIATEQKLLRTQMTPHFLFNSMSIIQGMILNGSYKKSLEYLNDFSKLLRLTLENSRNKTVSLEKELEAITSYVSLQNKTSYKPYDCQIHLDSNTDPTKIVLPPMLIQPFIENAIEHGFEETMNDKKINVTIQYDEGDLVCVITDNGVGINQTITKEKTTKTSMATQITKDRLKLLASEFNVKTGFSIMDRAIFSEKGTVVNLILPHKQIANA